jgi:hypothetical protein
MQRKIPFGTLGGGPQVIAVSIKKTKPIILENIKKRENVCRHFLT